MGHGSRGTKKIPLVSRIYAEQAQPKSIQVSIKCTSLYTAGDNRGRSNNIQNQETANYSLQAKSGPLPVFVNKVLLAHTNAHSFIHLPIIDGCLGATRVE